MKTIQTCKQVEKVLFAFAYIRGNCIADELAKVAAEEAKNYPEDSQILTCADFKKYAKLSFYIKWQRCWEVSDSGRHFL